MKLHGQKAGRTSVVDALTSGSSVEGIAIHDDALAQGWQGARN